MEQVCFGHSSRNICAEFQKSVKVVHDKRDMYIMITEIILALKDTLRLDCDFVSANRVIYLSLRDFREGTAASTIIFEYEDLVLTGHFFVLITAKINKRLFTLFLD